MEQPDFLIQSMQQGNERAFSKIYTMYSEAIYGIIYSIVLDDDIAEEVLQDVFIKIWKKSDSYNIKKGRFFNCAMSI